MEILLEERRNTSALNVLNDDDMEKALVATLMKWQIDQGYVRLSRNQTSAQETTMSRYIALV